MTSSTAVLTRPLPEVPVDSLETKAVIRRQPRRYFQKSILALPVVALAWMAWSHRNTFVDGYIYLHVVQNILAGHGPVFNQGQRVEAFTSPLWTFVVSAAGFLTPFPLEWLAVVLGILLTLAGTSIAILGSSRLVHRASPGSFLLPIGAVVFVAIPPIWSLSSTGLETGLTFFWLGTCLMLLVRWADGPYRPMTRYGLVILGLGPLVRPELAIDSLVLVGVLLCVDWSTQSWRDRLRVIGWAVAVPIAYQIFRMGYYGVLVSNVATAKEATDPRVGRGIQYFADFVGPYWMFIPAAALFLGAYYPLALVFRRTLKDNRELWALLALPTAGALNAVYVIVMGGDYVHGRLLVAPFFAACAPIAVIPMARRYVIALLVLPWALICSLSLRSADDGPWNSSPFTSVNLSGQIAEIDWGLRGSDHNWYQGPGTYVNFGGVPAQTQHLSLASTSDGHSFVLATSWIGTASFELGTNVRILDLLGLADPLTAHLALSKRGEFAGHEKPLPVPWIAALLSPDGSSAQQLAALQHERPTGFTPLIPSVSGRQLQIETAWARAALTCPAIHDLEYSTSRPLTFGSFISNVYHSFARTEIRIPPQPETAYHRFCGPGIPPQVRQIVNGPA